LRRDLFGFVQMREGPNADFRRRLLRALLGDVFAGWDLADDLAVSAFGESGGVCCSWPKEKRSGARWSATGVVLFAIFPNAVRRERKECESQVIAGGAGFDIAAEVAN
jgi:hypothetical protein